MKYLPLDIYTSLDHKTWLDEFEWPVNNSEILKVRKIIERQMWECFTNERSELCRKLLGICFQHLITEYISLYRSLLLIERTKSSEIILDAKKQLPFWSLVKDILNDGVPSQSIIDPKGLEVTCKQRIKYILKSLSGSLAYLPSLLKYRTGNMISEFLLFLNHSTLKEYGTPAFRHELYWKRFPCEINKRVTVSDSLFISSVELVTDLMINLFENNELTLSQPIKKHIRELTYKYYKQTMSYYTYNRSNKKTPKRLLAGSGCNYYIRLFGQLVKDKGGVVTCFEHGEPNAIYKNSYQGYCEFGICNRYMTYTKHCAELYQDTWADTIKLQDCLPEMITPPEGGEPTLKSVFTEHGKGKTISYKGPKVLYVTSAFRNDFASISCRPADMVYLEWQHYLLDILQKLDYQVACKLHHDGILKDRKFEPFEDINYLNGNFKDTLGTDNILIFDHTGSTAFAIALCADQPIVLIDNGFLSLHDEARGYLAERCEILKGYFDDKNRFRVDEEKLRMALINATKSKNFDFVYRYLTGPNI